MTLRMSDSFKKASEKLGTVSKSADDITKSDIYNQIFTKYEQLREGNFTESRIVDENFTDYAATPSENIRVERKNWYYRKPASITHIIGDYTVRPKERLSLNCVAKCGLIDALDEYFASGIVRLNGMVVAQRTPAPKGYYKVPEENSMWKFRSDPVTLYFMDKIPEQVLSDIKFITQPFRNPTPVAETDRVFKDGQVANAPWMSYAKEPQPEDVSKLIQTAKQIDPVLAEGIFMYVKSDGITLKFDKENRFNSLFVISVGQYYAIKELVNERYKETTQLRIAGNLKGNTIG